MAQFCIFDRSFPLSFSLKNHNTLIPIGELNTKKGKTAYNQFAHGTKLNIQHIGENGPFR